MLFSSLSDPIDHARAQAAFEAAWNEIRSRAGVDGECRRGPWPSSRP